MLVTLNRFVLAHLRATKVVVFLACLAPFAYLVWALFADRLGANPVDTLTRDLGEWALRFLLLTLLMTPLQVSLKQSWAVRLRRMLGLYAFFYVFVHFFTWLLFDKSFLGSEILADIIKRPFITVGVAAFVLLIPLAVTSTRRMQRRLGRNWKRLHRLIYIAAVAAVLHYFWLVKADIFMPSVYAVLLAGLLGYRLWRWKPRISTRERAPAQASRSS